MAQHFVYCCCLVIIAIWLDFFRQIDALLKGRISDYDSKKFSPAMWAVLIISIIFIMISLILGIIDASYKYDNKLHFFFETVSFL